MSMSMWAPISSHTVSGDIFITRGWPTREIQLGYNLRLDTDEVCHCKGKAFRGSLTIRAMLNRNQRNKIILPVEGPTRADLLGRLVFNCYLDLFITFTVLGTPKELGGKPHYLVNPSTGKPANSNSRLDSKNSASHLSFFGAQPLIPSETLFQSANETEGHSSPLNRGY